MRASFWHNQRCAGVILGDAAASGEALPTMPNETDATAPGPAFRQAAAAAGLDTADADRMRDLERRVSLMRQGLARLNEIPVAGAESPSVFIPSRLRLTGPDAPDAP